MNIGEFLKRDDFIDGFESQLSKKLNGTKPVPTVMGE